MQQCTLTGASLPAETVRKKKVKAARSNTGGGIRSCKWVCVCAPPTSLMRGRNNRECTQRGCPPWQWKNDRQWSLTEGKQHDIPNIPEDMQVRPLLHANPQGTHIVYDRPSASWYFCTDAHNGSHDYVLYARMQAKR